MDYTKIDSFIDMLVRESTPDCTAWNLEKAKEKKGSWNYIDGCMLNALAVIGRLRNNESYFEFIKEYVDFFVDDNGSISTYKKETYNLDNINEGRILFTLYERTGDRKYVLAAEELKDQLNKQPRTKEGNYWHKAIYENQVWLDGIYMAQPFAAMYEKAFGKGDYSDITGQISNVRKHMFSEEKGLYFHGYDSEKEIFWADRETGCSKNFWLRSIGWFAVALADLIDIIPKEKQGELPEILKELCLGIIRYRDEESAMYYQVPDKGGLEGNYLETSGSAMLAYAMLKGARLGVLPSEYACYGRETFEGIMKKYMTWNGTVPELGGICLVAGLGPRDNPRRDGSYEYYISEPVVKNDAKGVAPFVMCYTEILQMK